MIASANEKDGRVGVVIDNGCLFRGGKEKAIRTAALTSDKIEAVILLPEKLFYNTGAPGAILILNKNKPADKKGKILFINASHEFRQHPEVRKLNQLADPNIGNIAKAYKEFKEIDGFSRIVGLNEMKENDFNLNVTLYVFPEEEAEKIDVEKEWEDLRRLEKESAEVEAKIEGYLKEIYREK
jgi:type I restriction enzyme M protein